MDHSEKEKKQKKNSWKSEILEWIIVIEVAVVVAVILNLFIIVNAVIPTASMEPTVMTGDRVFGNRLAYLSEDPQRGDIVMFKFPDDESQLFIKRIIGMPGETLEMKDGKIYINGSDTALDEPYLTVVPVGDYGPVTIPEDAYFMMGDNRNISADSRYWVNTFVYREKIEGKAALKYYPNIKKL
ncbi:MAG TPA: signal peptidase I [Lachnospiraceae bacterium]|jgi:signal peptidase I|nr:signal peptidase I [Lachnospiraceae bacterium]